MISQKNVKKVIFFMKVKNTRQRSANLVPFFMRMPPALRSEIETLARCQNKSQASVAVELMQKGMGVHGTEMKEAVQDWLARNRERVS